MQRLYILHVRYVCIYIDTVIVTFIIIVRICVFVFIGINIMMTFVIIYQICRRRHRLRRCINYVITLLPPRRTLMY